MKTDPEGSQGCGGGGLAPRRGGDQGWVMLNGGPGGVWSLASSGTGAG